MAAYLTIPDVEICSVGLEWKTANGKITLTREHLADAVAAQDDPLITRPRLKLGHNDPRFDVDDVADHDPFADYDGEPAFGSLANMRLENDGAMIIGDFVNVPAWLAEAAASAYPSRSFEGAYIDGAGWHVETAAHRVYSMVITAVSLLGIFLPAVEDLEDLQAVLARGEGVTVDAGVIEAAGIKAMERGYGKTKRGAEELVAAEAVASIDRVIESFCSDFCVGEHFYWWPRELLVDPDSVIADDNSGHLARVPFTTDDDQNVEFGDPQMGLMDFREVEPAVRAKMYASALGVTAAATFTERCDHPILASREPLPITAESVSDSDWDGSASRFTDQEYARACVLDRAKCGEGWKEKPAKERYSLPCREPSGTLNKAGVIAAAGRLGATKACDAAKKAAAKKLLGYYKNDLKMDPPDSLTEAAKASKRGVSASGTTQPMDLSDDFREFLGLPEDATEEQATEAVEAAKAKLTAEPPEPVAASAELPEGTVVIEKDVLDELKENAEKGAVARSEQIKSERGRIVELAIKAGKIPPARRDHYLAAFEADHDGTKTLLTASKEEGGLAEGLVPVGDLKGSSADPDLVGDEAKAAQYMAAWGIGKPTEKTAA